MSNRRRRQVLTLKAVGIALLVTALAGFMFEVGRWLARWDTDTATLGGDTNEH